VAETWTHRPEVLDQNTKQGAKNSDGRQAVNMTSNKVPDEYQIDDIVAQKSNVDLADCGYLRATEPNT
jgi:cephalosporin hydroxylase